MPYLPIEDYGLIGNMHTAALVGRNGSIDWLCLPHFDSPSVFAAILDDKKGGYFRIAPTAERVTRKQVYWPETNVLITRFLLDDGVVEVIDYMPVGLKRGDPGFRQLVRRVEAIRGSVPVYMECYPAFNYARDTHKVDITDSGAVFRSDGLDLELTTRVPLTLRHDRGGVEAVLELKQGEKAVFVLRPLDPKHKGAQVFPDGTEQALFEQTVRYWHKWLSKCAYKGRWREMVYRSALLLKLLTFEPTGALVAAPTTSLPEAIPGPRNWDYRYTWIRDASFSLYALLRLGFTEEAAAFIGWIEKRCHELKHGHELQVMYRVNGSPDLPEHILKNFQGYENSQPVRIGNAACDQLQLDIYGELLEAIFVYDAHGGMISYDFWMSVTKFVDWICGNWRRPDNGIWEVRGGMRRFLHSRVMCWVTLDRAMRLAQKRSFPAPLVRWHRIRDEIYKDIYQHYWNPKLKAFVQYRGGKTVDASSLLMPLVSCISPSDPRWHSTMDVIEKTLVEDSLVYRYRPPQAAPDGMKGNEGTFSMCSFWYVECLARAGDLKKARFLFEKALGYSNHVGLYAEQLGASGEHLGNFPQALSHIALISAAWMLDKKLSEAGAPLS